MGNSGRRKPDSGERRADSGTLPSLGYSAPTIAHQFTRLTDAATEDHEAPLAAEVPVALVYNARPHVVMMCTPADLEDFAVGFTLTEGIVGRAADIGRVETVKYSRGVELQIEIPAAASDRLAERARAITGRTGCGLCGVEVIDQVFRELREVRSSLTVSRSALWRASESLATHQPLNRETSAIHAAAWASKDGTLRVVREDVGRHNALDKVLGALGRAGTDASEGFVLVTSRASYELVQKAAAANVPVLAAVSRPSALAVQLANDAGIALVGLLRGRTANVYTHRERIADSG
jgi:formate dehydrogenase accessory protein FdhD